MQPHRIATWSQLEPLSPAHALVGEVDLVIVRREEGENLSVLYGRCLHRGALLADGHIEGPNLICGVHNWDYRYQSGISEYHNEEALEKFTAWVEDDGVWVDADEVRAWAASNPQPYDRTAYQGAYQDPHGASEEPHVRYITNSPAAV